MGIAGSRVGIVGGSIAGCAAAIALRRAGCAVAVYERTRGELKDRGAGIAIPVALRDQLVRAGYLDPGYPTCPSVARLWLLRDGDDPLGRLLWRQPSPAAFNNWGVLWRSVRARLPDAAYHEGAAVTAIATDQDGATVQLQDGSRARVDLLVGADGYRSGVRGLLHPHSRPAYAGYTLWRGSFDERLVTDRRPLVPLEGGWTTVVFVGGHGIFYLIPGFDNRADPGHRRVNWAIYCAAPPGVSFAEPGSLPPGSVDARLLPSLDALLDAHFPPAWAALVRATPPEALLIQPIYDQTIPTYVGARLLLIGDASTLTRPHTGSGATKALQDAIALEQACRAHATWDAALAAYDAARCQAGNDVVELGRRIGRDQVLQTPDWATMTPERFDAFTRATLAGRALYLYGNTLPADARG